MNALIVTAIFSDLIDHRYWRAAAFCFVAIWLSMFGVMHSNNLQGHSIGADGRATQGEVTWAQRAPGNEGWRFAIAYSVVCAGLIASHFLQKAGFTVATRRLHFTRSPRRRRRAARGCSATASVPRRTPSSRTSTPRPSKKPSPRPRTCPTRARTSPLAPTRCRPRSRTCPRATPSRPRAGASCTYSSHVKSHAAHSPASTFASA